MNLASSASVAEHCRANEYSYIPHWLNPPLSGVLFQSRAFVYLEDVVDASGALYPFLLARARARGRRHGVAVLSVPLLRPVPNMLLVGAKASALARLGIALREDQRLTLEGEFSSRFILYCPREYEIDALYVFTPDLMAHLVDVIGILDAEFVDDRLLLYAPLQTFYRVDSLGRAAGLVALLRDRLDRQTKRYADQGRADCASKDPFRRALLTTPGDKILAIGDGGRRIQTRLTAWQKASVAVAVCLAAAAACYWIGMVLHAIRTGR